MTVSITTLKSVGGRGLVSLGNYAVPLEWEAIASSPALETMISQPKYVRRIWSALGLTPYAARI